MTPTLRVAIQHLPPRAARALATLFFPDFPAEPTLLAHTLRFTHDADIFNRLNSLRTPAAADLIERLTGLPGSSTLARTHSRVHYSPKPDIFRKIFP